MSRKSHIRFEDVQFGTYIYRVLKQVHPDAGMSGDGLAMVNNLIRIFIQRIVANTNRLMLTSGGRKTISSREIQSATRLTLPGELSKHAVSEATKAVTRYNSHEGPQARNGQRAKPVSRGTRAGLQFPVTRIENVMMELATVNRKGAGAAVYLTAVIEYLVAEVLELGGNAARDFKKIRITPRHLKLAILNDQELSRLCQGIVMSGGVVPSIHSRLLPKKKDPSDDAAAPVRRKKPTSRKPPKKTVKKSTTKTAKKPTKKTSSPAPVKGKTPVKGKKTPAKSPAKAPTKPVKKAPTKKGKSRK